MDTPQLIERLMERDVLYPVLICAGIVVSVVVKTAGRTIAAVSRERTRREIAAYIAEGSMNPDQGERLMKAGGGKSEI